MFIMEFFIQSILDRNEPARFFGDGVVFKAKLIGILEVGEARGDRMCQEALQDLKIAIRAAGEHKQRITIHVTIEGLRLRDEKTGVSIDIHSLTHNQRRARLMSSLLSLPASFVM